MKILNFLSDVAWAFKSIWANKRRSLAIGAGMVLGATIFASVFFYGTIINSIAVADIVENTEAEVMFYPTKTSSLTPTDLASLIQEESEIEDVIIMYGENEQRDTQNVYFEQNMQTIENFTSFRPHEIVFPKIVDESFTDSAIVNSIDIVVGENTLSSDGVLLSYQAYKEFNLQVGQTISFNYTLMKMEFTEYEHNISIVYQRTLNLTINGFYRTQEMSGPFTGYGGRSIIMSSAVFEKELIDVFVDNLLFSLPTKLDFNKLPVNDLGNLNDAIDRIIFRIEEKSNNALTGRNAIGFLIVMNQFMLVLMQIIDMVLYIPAIVLSLILINFGAELALQERKYEVSVLKAQGASPKQIRFQIFTEVIIIGIIGEVIGLFLGALGAASVISIYSFMNIDLVEFTRALSLLQIKTWTIIVTAIVTLGVLLITTAKKTNVFIQQEVALASTIDKEKEGWFKKIYGDVIFFFLGLIGVVLSITQAINPNISFGFGIQLVQFFSPLTLWYGSAGVASRISVKVPEKLDKILLKIFRDIGILIKGSLSRRDQSFPRITVLLCLSISLSVLSAVQGETGTYDLTRQAEFQIGGEMKLDIGYGSTLTKENFTGLEDKIDTVIPIYSAEFTIGQRLITVYGADLSLYRQHTFIHPDSMYKADTNTVFTSLSQNKTKNVIIGWRSAFFMEVNEERQEFNVMTPTGSNTTINIVGQFDHLPGGIMDSGSVSSFTCFTSKEFILEHAPETPIVSAIVNFKSNVDPEKENLSFEFINNFDFVSDAITFEDYYEQVKQAQGRNFGIPGLLTIAFLVSQITALIGVFIFMFMIINRRRKEFAILIAEGASRKQLILLVLSEILSMAFFATIFGTIIGGLLAFQFNGFFDLLSTSTMNRRLIFPPITLSFTVLGSFAVIILATLLPAIAASRIKVVEEMRVV